MTCNNGNQREGKNTTANSSCGQLNGTINEIPMCWFMLPEIIGLDIYILFIIVTLLKHLDLSFRDVFFLIITIPYVPLSVGIDPENMKPSTQNTICSTMFTAAVLAITRAQKQHNCLPIDDWIKMMWQIHIMEYYSAIRKD